MAQGDVLVTVVGNLTGDPELRFTPNGQAVASFTVASTTRVLDRSTNEWKDGDTMFLRCSVWRQYAENVAESLTKGTRVIVTGRLKQRSYETKEGEKRSVVELDVDDVGPALRNATAKVTRAARGDSGGFSGGSSGGHSSGGGVARVTAQLVDAGGTVRAAASSNGEGAAAAKRKPRMDNPMQFYPPEAIARGIEGETILLLRYNPDGTLRDAKIARSSGYAILDQAALRAVRATPRAPEGQREVLFPVTFSLQ